MAGLCWQKGWVAGASARVVVGLPLQLLHPHKQVAYASEIARNGKL